IAGGSLPGGTASTSVFGYRPTHGRVVRLGRLPAATTHAAAATLDGIALVIGGRGAALRTPTDRIVGIDPSRRRVRLARRLTSPPSDLAAVAIGGRILLAGGLGPLGTTSAISELVPTSTTDTTAAVNIYAADGAGRLTGAARLARQLVYVPNSQSASVDEIDPRTFRIVRHFAVAALPQHVVPSYDLRHLYVTNDLGNSLTIVDPRTGTARGTIPVADPYNMYFTPDGRYSVVVAERLRRLDFRDPQTFALDRSLTVPCQGIDHMDFSADGRYLLASCEFSGQLVKVDVASQSVVGVLDLPGGRGDMPQDVRLSPDGGVFYVADLAAGGVWKIYGASLTVAGFVATGRGPHGLYPSRDGRLLYVSNRGEG